jgi:hypothetical protein
MCDAGERIVAAPRLDEFATSPNYALVLELDGNSVVTDIDAAIKGTEKVVELERAGYTRVPISTSIPRFPVNIRIYTLSTIVERPTTLEPDKLEVQAQEYFDFRLQQVMDLLQLTALQVEDMWSIYKGMLQHGEDKLSIKRLLQSLGLPNVPILRYIAAFLECDDALTKTAPTPSKPLSMLQKMGIASVPEDESLAFTPRSPYVANTCCISFSEFAHIVSTIGLMDTQHLVQFMFSFADPNRLQAIPEDSAVGLVKDMLECAPRVASNANILTAIRHAPRDSIGLIPLESFAAVCDASPVLTFGISRFKEAVTKSVFGHAWWTAKCSKFQALRGSIEAKRDQSALGKVAEEGLKASARLAAAQQLQGTAAEHPTAKPETDAVDLLSHALFLEMVCRRSVFIRDCFVESRKWKGVVAICTIHTHAALQYGREHRLHLADAFDDPTKMCSHPLFRKAVMTDIRTQLHKVQTKVPDEDTIKAIHLTTVAFTNENGLLLPAAKGMGHASGGAGMADGSQVQLLDRENIRKRYQRVLEILFSAALEEQSALTRAKWMQAEKGWNILKRVPAAKKK